MWAILTPLSLEAPDGAKARRLFNQRKHRRTKAKKGRFAAFAEWLLAAMPGGATALREGVGVLDVAGGSSRRRSRHFYNPVRRVWRRTNEIYRARARTTFSPVARREGEPRGGARGRARPATGRRVIQAPPRISL